MKLPKFFAVCDDCWDNSPEVSCRYAEEIGWHPEAKRWLCDECWGEVPTQAEEGVAPLVMAKDALDDEEEMLRRLIAAAAKKRLGV
jgi:hypothetical protein